MRGNNNGMANPGTQPPVGSVVRDLASATEVCQGRNSFDDDGQPVPVKVLGPAFDNAAMAPPPPRPKSAPATASEQLKVYCRLRPLNAGETGGVVEAPDEFTVRAMPLQRPGRHAHREARDYSFTQAFNSETSQQQVYEATTAPLIDSLFEGRSALLFTYGVTNAGKSYTMMGAQAEQAGIMPRALDAVLARANSRAEGHATPTAEVYVSFIEVYNENIFDLMDKTTTSKRRALRLKDRGDRMEINNLSSQRVSSTAHGLALARAAQAQRKTAATGLNNTSSRSHSICQLEIRPADGPNVVLMLVDLAGSERIERTGANATGAQQKEANHINQSVSRLMHCLRVLREKQGSSTAALSTVVPWRESKLTHLFQHLLAPSNVLSMARVSMIVNVSPSAGDHAETCYVMGNAASAKALAVRVAQPNGNHLKPRTAAYDQNGRRLDTNQAQQQQQQQQQHEKKRKFDKASTDSSNSAGTAATEETITSPSVEHVKYLENEVFSLREALAQAHEAVSEVEREVRTECAQEMAATIEGIQREYTRKLRARSSVALPMVVDAGHFAESTAVASPKAAEGDAEATARKRAALGMSARKEQQHDELEKYIESLEEQFEETEAELDRVRKAAAAEVDQLRAQLAAVAVAAAAGSGGLAPVAMMEVDAGRAAAATEAELEAEVDRLRAALGASEAAAQRTRAEAEAAVQDAAAWKSRSELSEALNAANEENERRLAASHAQATADAGSAKDQATQRLQAAREESEQLRAQLAEQTRALDAARDDLKAAQTQLGDLQARELAMKTASPPAIVAIYADQHQQQAAAAADPNAAPPPPPQPTPMSPNNSNRGKSPVRAVPYSKLSKRGASPLASHPVAKENSPVIARSVKEVASSLDARARAMKDERIARAKAQQTTGGASSPPVAKRTRGYKVL